MEESRNERAIARRLILYGFVLILLGLLTGLVIPVLQTPRLGLSAHINGVMGGLILIVVGAVWEKLSLFGRNASVVFRLLVYSAFMNWIATLLGATFGTSMLTPLAGEGKRAALWQEGIIAALLVSLVISIFAAIIMIIAALLKAGDDGCG